MSTPWVRAGKLLALIAGVFLLLLAANAAFPAPMDFVEQIAHDNQLSIEERQQVVIDGRPLAVVWLSAGNERVILALDRARGYRSRFWVAALYATNATTPQIIIAGDAESSRVEDLLPRSPTATAVVLDALTAATVTAQAIDRAIQRCDIARASVVRGSL